MSREEDSPTATEDVTPGQEPTSWHEAPAATRPRRRGLRVAAVVGAAVVLAGGPGGSGRPGRTGQGQTGLGQTAQNTSASTSAILGGLVP